MVPLTTTPFHDQFVLCHMSHFCHGGGKISTPILIYMVEACKVFCQFHIQCEHNFPLDKHVQLETLLQEKTLQGCE